MIGCISVIERGSRIVAIDCHKGRGIICPGGKFELGETFEAAAARELLEETGLKATHQSFIAGGPDDDGVFVYAYLTDVEPCDQLDQLDGFGSYDLGSGKVLLATWDDLLKSHYRAFYSFLRARLRE